MGARGPGPLSILPIAPVYTLPPSLEPFHSYPAGLPLRISSGRCWTKNVAPFFTCSPLRWHVLGPLDQHLSYSVVPLLVLWEPPPSSELRLREMTGWRLPTTFLAVTGSIPPYSPPLGFESGPRLRYTKSLPCLLVLHHQPLPRDPLSYILTVSALRPIEFAAFAVTRYHLALSP